MARVLFSVMSQILTSEFFDDNRSINSQRKVRLCKMHLEAFSPLPGLATFQADGGSWNSCSCQAASSHSSWKQLIFRFFPSPSTVWGGKEENIRSRRRRRDSLSCCCCYRYSCQERSCCCCFRIGRQRAWRIRMKEEHEVAAAAAAASVLYPQP